MASQQHGSFVARVLDDLGGDLRHGLRWLRRNPGFTTVAVATLGLGIGANTAVFSIVNAVLLRPLAFAEPERLVHVAESNPTIGRVTASVSVPNYLDWRTEAGTFEGLAAFENDDFTLALQEGGVNARGANVTANFFAVLGVQVTRGRDFLATEDQPGGDARVAILTDASWRARFGSDPDALGRRVRIDGEDHTIVGVLPADVRWRTGARWEDVEAFVPMTLNPLGDRDNRVLTVVGRLRDGVTIQEAQQDLDRISAGLADRYPVSNVGWSTALVSFQDWLVPDDARTSLVVLLGAAGLLLLIACANIAYLLLARLNSRHHELSIRIALGASQIRMSRQLFVESSLLSLLAVVFGGACAVGMTRLLAAYAPSNVPRLDEASLDLRVAGFAIGVAVATTFLFGAIPAVQARRHSLTAALQDAGRASSAGRSRQRWRSTIVVAQVALSVTLLIGSGLLLRSFWNLQRVSPGFDPSSVMIARATTEPGSDRRVFYERLLAELEGLPGVVVGTAASGVPTAGGYAATEFLVPATNARDEQTGSAAWSLISPGYFDTMGIPLRGREYSWSDQSGEPWTIIVSEAMASALWPDQDPMGQTIVLQSLGNRARTVIGVAGDIRHVGLDTEPRFAVYYSTTEVIAGSMHIAWRSTDNPEVYVASVRELAGRIDPTAIVDNFRSMDAVLAESVAPRRFNMQLIGSFAMIALLLASVGLFGVTAFLVSQRTREIGVRLALGATRAQIAYLVVGHGLTVALLGAAIGVGGASWLSGITGTLLFAVSTTDTLTFIAVPALVVLVTVAACYVPARRAANVSPVTALRGP